MRMYQRHSGVGNLVFEAVLVKSCFIKTPARWRRSIFRADALPTASRGFPANEMLEVVAAPRRLIVAIPIADTARDAIHDLSQTVLTATVFAITFSALDGAVRRRHLPCVRGH